jgi:hypothetical protein
MMDTDYISIWQINWYSSLEVQLLVITVMYAYLQHQGMDDTMHGT